MCDECTVHSGISRVTKDKVNIKEKISIEH